jgi:hypothetical protein
LSISIQSRFYLNNFTTNRISSLRDLSNEVVNLRLPPQASSLLTTHTILRICLKGLETGSVRCYFFEILLNEANKEVAVGFSAEVLKNPQLIAFETAQSNFNRLIVDLEERLHFELRPFLAGFLYQTDIFEEGALTQSYLIVNTRQLRHLI